VPSATTSAEAVIPVASSTGWRRAPNTPLWIAVLLGALGFLLWPWYALQDASGIVAIAGAWDSAQTGNGVLQAVRYGRPWLLGGLAGLVVCGAAAARRPGRAQGTLLLAGGFGGLGWLVATGFCIGAKGWSVGALEAALGPLAAGQPGMGWGAACSLAALLALGSFGLARRGSFRGDLFVAAAVCGAGALLLLFIVYPVLKVLAEAFVPEEGQAALPTFVARLANERNFSLACLGGASRCGVAWNTLFLGVLTATSTTLLGTLMALASERGRRRFARPMNIVAMLPIITPPFVVGLGLILLFGRAGVANQLLEWAFGITPTRWFYGAFGIWIAQTFAFTPIAFMIMRGVVQGIAPSLEEAAQTLRATPAATFRTITLPLLGPGLANAFLVGFIESMADFGNPIVVGGQFSVLSTEIFFAIVGAQFDQGRAASLAWLLTLFALAVFALQRFLLGRRSYTTVSGKGDAGIPMALPPGVRGLVNGIALPWMAFTLVVYLFALVGGFVQTWGRDYTPTLAHFRTAFSVEWGAFGLVWAGTAWNSFFTTF
jgi:iron(III) transport system permease protein